ncbi:MAG: hypothetical protein ACJAZY_001349 [Spirosomataceae bacterium]|jgi:hypothetical protein
MGQSVDKPIKVMFYRSGLSGKYAKTNPPTEGYQSAG